MLQFNSCQYIIQRIFMYVETSETTGCDYVQSHNLAMLHMKMSSQCCTNMLQFVAYVIAMVKYCTFIESA